MRIIRQIIQSAMPPSDYNAVWLYKGSLYYYEQGSWVLLSGKELNDNGQYEPSVNNEALDKINSSIDSLNKNYSTLSNKYDTLNENLNSFTKDINNKVSDLSTQLNTLKESLDTINTQFSTLQQQLKDNTDYINTIKGRVVTYKEE